MVQQLNPNYSMSYFHYRSISSDQYQYQYLSYILGQSQLQILVLLSPFLFSHQFLSLFICMNILCVSESDSVTYSSIHYFGLMLSVWKPTVNVVNVIFFNLRSRLPAEHEPERILQGYKYLKGACMCICKLKCI